MLLKEKIAVVTGGGSGIGLAVVQDFLEEGARVLAVDLEPGALNGLGAGESGRLAFFRADVGREEENEAMLAAAAERFGGLDILVNNAGVGRLAESASCPTELWRRIQSVNLDGTFFGCRHAIRRFLETGGGSIVNVASIMGVVGSAGQTAYSATKSGILGMTRCLALEYAKSNIRVNAVCPGYIDSPMLAGKSGAERERLAALHPIGRLGRPEEIAHCVTFLASGRASFVTGAALVADGGYTAQ